MGRFMVQHDFLYGWDDAAWTVTDEDGTCPLRFGSVEEAVSEIDDHLESCRHDGPGGYERNQYRVAEVTEDDTGIKVVKGSDGEGDTSDGQDSPDQG